MSEFPGMSPGDNLPWGAKNDPSAPWNQPEAPDFDGDLDDLIEFLVNEEGLDRRFYMFEGAAGDGSDEDAWFVETWEGERFGAAPWGPFDTPDEAALFILHEDEPAVEEAFALAEREAWIDSQY